MRPQAFALCEKYMARQTRQPDEWIVVDDGEVKTPINLATTIIRPEIKWRPGANTQARNLLLALSQVKHDSIVSIIEDDDFITPDHLMSLESCFDDSIDLVGQTGAVYYNISIRKWRTLGNIGHACFSQTVFRGSLIPLLENLLLNPPNLWHDYNFWQRCYYYRSPWLLPPPAKTAVGMKGMPGRSGIGVGHWSEHREWVNDDNYVDLKALIGEEDAQAYINL